MMVNQALNHAKVIMSAGKQTTSEQHYCAINLHLALSAITRFNPCLCRIFALVHQFPRDC